MKETFSILLCMCLTLANAQDYPRERIDLSKLTDNILTWQDEDIGYEEIYENYVQLYANPIDLNTASFDDLHLINILTDNQINQLLEYRKENGALLSVYELQSVPGFDLQAIQNLIPFVIINKTTTSHSILDRITNNRNSYLIWRYEKTLESSDGFNTPNPEQRFKGSPDKLYLRFRNSRPNDYSFGLTAEKDAGEQLLWRPGSNQYGSDFLSYHLQLSNKRKLKTLVLGDYQCQFGQGLILGNTFGLGKGGEPVITTRKSNIGFLPYTSVNEANYMRGIATTYQLSNNIFVSAMYSNTYRDASVDGDEVPTFSSINITGLHRNEKEIQNRKQVKEQVSAGIINYRNKTIDAGIIFQKINFSIPISKDANAYNQHTFKGDENINTSFFFNYTTQNFNFFSEAAKSLDGGLGIITGALASLHEDLDMALIYRKYDPDFYPFYGNGFSESTITQNENGFYWGFKYRLDRKYSIAAYADLFSFPWNRYRVYKPSNGHEYLLRINYQPTKKVLAFIQFRQETKMRNVADQQNLYSIGTGIKRNLWINTDYYVTPKVRMKTRAQFSTYSLDNEITKGIALVQDLQIDLGKLEVSARHALFDTDNYDNRQYIYENDVWLAYSLPALEGTGIRNYIMLEYKVSKWLSLWLRFAKTRYSNKDEIGSGIQRINGNTKNDIKLQAVLHF